jgi:hypothetical protein
MYLAQSFVVFVFVCGRRLWRCNAFIPGPEVCQNMRNNTHLLCVIENGEAIGINIALYAWCREELVHTPVWEHRPAAIYWCIVNRTAFHNRTTLHACVHARNGIVAMSLQEIAMFGNGEEEVLSDSRTLSIGSMLFVAWSRCHQRTLSVDFFFFFFFSNDCQNKQLKQK